MGILSTSKAAVYLGVGTSDETSATHEHALREAANRMGCEIVKVYRDDAVGSAKGRACPQLKKLCLDAYNRKFDVVMAWSIEGLGRSFRDLIGFLSEIHALKIDLYLHQQGIDTTTSAGKAIFEMTPVLAEFDRAMLREKLRANRAKAKQYGKKLGRPRIDATIENAIRDALQKDDAGIIKIATRFGVGTGTVQRIKAAMVL
jgi:DNA invertase Pin-like site-specific DNA recombinase